MKNKELIQYLKNLLQDDFKSFLDASPEPKSIRINTLKTDTEYMKQLLDRAGVSYSNVSFHENGLIIHGDSLPLSHTLSFFKGDIQYQGISSQLPVILLDVKEGQRVLDMCAAPGSKSAQLTAAMNNSGELILNDISHTRLQALNVNMQRSGATNFYIMKNRGEEIGSYLYQYFDKVLVDVPCTALGTLSSHPEVAKWWSNDKLKKISLIQYQLVVSALKALKTGGELVYSTCSIAPEENEQVIRKILDNYPVELVQPPAVLQGMFSSAVKNNDYSFELDKAIRIWPHRHKLEGFFAVKLRKTDSIRRQDKNREPEFIEIKDSSDILVRMILENISNNWGIPFKEWDKYRFNVTKTRIWMVNKDIKKCLTQSFVSAGILLAESRLLFWKLVNGSVQRFADKINKRKIELSDEQIYNLFSKGYIAYKEFPGGYYALCRKGEPVASVYIHQNELKIHLPHKFRLVFLEK